MGKHLKSAKPHYLGHKKRLREKFINNDFSSLNDYEALELILGMAIVRKDVKPLAKNLIKKFGSFAAALDADPAELKCFEGLGEIAALSLKIVKEASVKYLQEKSRVKPVISSPEALIDYCKAAMGGLKEEEFRVVFLNSRNEIIDDEVLCKGTVDQAAVYPRKIMERALNRKASSLIFVHNHPSGHPNPSRADIELTKTLQNAAAALQIRVHDHLIVGKQGQYSFAKEGIL